MSNTGCPEKVLLFEKSPKFFLKADLQIYFSWRVDQRPYYFPSIADHLISLKLVNRSLVKAV